MVFTPQEAPILEVLSAPRFNWTVAPQYDPDEILVSAAILLFAVALVTFLVRLLLRQENGFLFNLW